VGTLLLFIHFLRIHNVPGNRCIDEGKLVEQGTRAELINERDGRHAEFYNVQASAFST